MLAGNGRHDTLYGGEGDDALYGGDGNDDLNGDQSNDFLDGGAGSDTYTGWSGIDGAFAYVTMPDNGDLTVSLQVASLNGTAIACFVRALPSVSHRCHRWDNKNIIRMVITGGDGKDIISAQYSDVTVSIKSGKGDDRIVGSPANDILEGGDGRDWIYNRGDVYPNGGGGGGYNLCFRNSGNMSDCDYDGPNNLQAAIRSYAGSYNTSGNNKAISLMGFGSFSGSHSALEDAINDLDSKAGGGIWLLGDPETQVLDSFWTNWRD